jgi:hypothetical protein
MLGGAGTAKGFRVQDEEGARGSPIHVKKEIKEGEEVNLGWRVFVPA